MTNTRSPQRITWLGYKDGFRGFIKPINAFADNHKYWVGPLDPGKPIIADVWSGGYDWHNLDIPFNTLEEAKAWCEACEATGAYE